MNMSVFSGCGLKKSTASKKAPIAKLQISAQSIIVTTTDDIIPHKFATTKHASIATPNTDRNTDTMFLS